MPDDWSDVDARPGKALRQALYRFSIPRKVVQQLNEAEAVAMLEVCKQMATRRARQWQAVADDVDTLLK